MSKWCAKTCLENCRVRCLECEQKCALETLLVATTYQSRSCRRELELCGFVHDHFMSEGDSVQLTWIESRLKERLNFERCADLGVDDGVDQMVTILNRLVTWSKQMGIEAKPRHREVLLARMSMDGFDICTVLCCGCEIRQTYQEI